MNTPKIELEPNELQALIELASRAPKTTAEALFLNSITSKAQTQLERFQEKPQLAKGDK